MLFKTRYNSTARLFDETQLAKLDGSNSKFFKKFIKKRHKTQLLLLDDFGLHAMEKVDRQILLAC